MSRPTTLAVVTYADSAYGREVLRGLSAAAASYGWTLALISGTSQIEAEVEHSRPDALVMSSPWFVELLEPWVRSRPSILTTHYHGATPVVQVHIDEAAVGREAASYLMQRGLRHFACFGLGQAQGDWSSLRARSFQQALAEAGHACVHWTERLDGDSVTFMSERSERCRGWLASLPKPAGVLACDDYLGMELLSHCNRFGVRVPEELCVVGVNNDELICEACRPALSSIEIPWQRMGRDIADLLERMLQGAPPPDAPVLVRPTAVAVRQSSDLMSVGDPDVTAALRVIAEHADKPLRVADLLRRVAAHRYQLERAFRRHLGRTMTEEIRRTHVEQAKRLLANTDLSMSLVAERSGFSDYKALGEAFRKEAGVTPTEYRRHVGNGARRRGNAGG